MPYRNIVFVKLEKRLLNDPRWYMLSEAAQLNFIRFMLLAAETYNRIPKNLEAIRKAFKTEQDLTTLEKTIKEIRDNFPKFKENKKLYYFADFETKTNYIRECPRNARSVPKEVAEGNQGKEKENKKEWIARFEKLWPDYPRRDGKKEALRHFLATVKTDGDWAKIQKALANFKRYVLRMGFDEKHIKTAKTWFNNWQDWVDYQEPQSTIATVTPEALYLCPLCNKRFRDSRKNEPLTCPLCRGTPKISDQSFALIKEDKP